MCPRALPTHSHVLGTRQCLRVPVSSRWPSCTLCRCCTLQHATYTLEAMSPRQVVDEAAPSPAKTPRAEVIEVRASARPERASANAKDAWWLPRKDMASLGPQYVSEYAFPGLNAQLAGKASQKHKRAWAQPEFMPQQLVDQVRLSSHTRVKQFFSYRPSEQGLGLQALALGARKPPAGGAGKGAH